MAAFDLTYGEIVKEPSLLNEEDKDFRIKSKIKECLSILRTHAKEYTLYLNRPHSDNAKIVKFMVSCEVFDNVKVCKKLIGVIDQRNEISNLCSESKANKYTTSIMLTLLSYLGFTDITFYDTEAHCVYDPTLKQRFYTMTNDEIFFLKQRIWKDSKCAFPAMPSSVIAHETTSADAMRKLIGN